MMSAGGETASFSWAGEPVAVNAIEDSLRQSWRQEAARAVEEEGLVARTSVLNLIVHTSSSEEAAQVAAMIEGLGGRHPSRTIILCAEPDGAEGDLHAWVKTQVQPLPGSTRRLIFEQVTIEARGETALHLPSVVDAMLVAELPNFLWWIGAPPLHAQHFTRMADIVDRLVIDSTRFGDVPRGLYELAELTVIPYGVIVSDFAWDRLRPWRELIAQFFDPPEFAASLTALERVEIVYDPIGRHQSSGFSEGVLIFGWLCSRLGWQTMQSPESDGPGSFQWTLTTRGRTVQVAILPEARDDDVAGLRRVVLTAGEDAPGVFQVYREGGKHISTEVSAANAPALDRTMQAFEPEEPDLLLHALTQFGHDRAYEGALVFAAQLMRGINGQNR